MKARPRRYDEAITYSYYRHFYAPGHIRACRRHFAFGDYDFPAMIFRHGKSADINDGQCRRAPLLTLSCTRVIAGYRQATYYRPLAAAIKRRNIKYMITMMAISFDAGQV